MKRPTPIPAEKPETHASSCPVKCLRCRYDQTHPPVSWREVRPQPDEPFETADTHTHRIVFVMEGAVAVRTAEGEAFDLSPDQCIFLARIKRYTLTATAPSRLVLLDFTNRVVLCNRDCLSRLSTGCNASEPSGPVLGIHPFLRQMVDHIARVDIPCYHLLKEHELFIMMRCLYTEQRLAAFFGPILRPDNDLQAFVMSCYRQVQGVDDFARMAHMSERTFRRKFSDTFGQTVHRWLVQQRGKDLLGMIANGERDTKRLAGAIGLTDQAALYQFCRRHFKCSVTRLIALNASGMQ